jgi:hypothetical protein
MSDETKKPARMGCLWSMLLMSVGFVAGFVLSCAIGAIGYWLNNPVGGQDALNHAQYELERDDVAAILAKDPAFKGVTIGEYSAGGIVLLGHVPTDSDLTRLRSAVSKALGDRLVSRVIGVQAESKASQ